MRSWDSRYQFPITRLNVIRGGTHLHQDIGLDLLETAMQIYEAQIAADRSTSD
jgi:hypothetical protein